MAAHDVRMRGFQQRSTVAEALNWLEKIISSLPSATESITLDAAYRRVLAFDVLSTINVPGFDRSAMDGYAVVAEETVGASVYSPVSLRIVGQSYPGSAYSESLKNREAVRIMTGAPIPEGATAVVPVEFTEADEAEVRISQSIAHGKNIGRTGEDVQSGDVVLTAGRQLRPQDVAVIASIGQDQVEVKKLPRVRIIVTGNELKLPGQPKEPHQIYEANSAILQGMIPRDGGIIESLQFVEDNQEAISAAMTEPGVDVILVSGGSSVGAEDFAPGIVREYGELPIHGIAMRPSSPTGLGRIGKTVIVLLPGNPVSCLCAYDFFAGRAIRTLAGRNPDWPYRKHDFELNKKVVSSIGRVDYCRVRIENSKASPLAISGASILSSTTRADGFLIVPEESEGLPAGARVQVFLYQ